MAKPAGEGGPWHNATRLPLRPVALACDPTPDRAEIVCPWTITLTCAALTNYPHDDIWQSSSGLASDLHQRFSLATGFPRDLAQPLAPIGDGHRRQKAPGVPRKIRLPEGGAAALHEEVQNGKSSQMS